MNHLISIIIPTLNRSHLIGSTLNSILKQTIQNWECIVVDDGSSDYTSELMEFYCDRDNRIRFLKRPKNRLQGANSCRNLGFEKSKGNFIQWFDSDDIMQPQFLEAKIKFITQGQFDFVISKTENFLDGNPNSIIDRNEDYYRFHQYDLTSFNYISQRINWLTPDLMCKRELAEKLRFNEKLQSAQERNFFSKLIIRSTNGIVLDQFLTRRRIHTSSVRHKLKKDSKRYSREKKEFYVVTWKEISNLESGTPSEEHLFVRAVNLDIREWPSFRASKIIALTLIQQKRFILLVWWSLHKSFFWVTGRGHYLRRKTLDSFSLESKKESKR